MYYDVTVSAPGYDPEIQIIDAPGELDAKARACRAYANHHGINPQDVTAQAEETTPGG